MRKFKFLLHGDQFPALHLEDCALEIHWYFTYYYFNSVYNCLHTNLELEKMTHTKMYHYDEIISCLHEDFSCRGMLCWRNAQNEPVISAMILCPAAGDDRCHMCLYLLLCAYLFKLNSLHQRTDECDIRVSPKR